jgi:hypothetical protein
MDVGYIQVREFCVGVVGDVLRSFSLGDREMNSTCTVHSQMHTPPLNQSSMYTVRIYHDFVSGSCRERASIKYCEVAISGPTLHRLLDQQLVLSRVLW